MEWAIEVCKETNLPIAASMCIGPEGDLHGITAAECAVRMAKAGANVGKQRYWLSLLLKTDYEYLIFTNGKIILSSLQLESIAILTPLYLWIA